MNAPTIPMPPPGAQEHSAYLVATVDIDRATIVHVGIYSAPANRLTLRGPRYRMLDVHHLPGKSYDESSKAMQVQIRTDPYFGWVLPLMQTRGR